MVIGKDYHGFIVYPDRRVWSKSRNKFITCNNGKNWYPTISVEGKKLYVHRIVAELFIPNPYNYKYINHKDGDKLNFHVDNLEWVNASMNIIHAFKSGLSKRSSKENHPSAKLSNIDVYIIREAIVSGFAQKDIAKYYRVNPSTICSINIKRKWISL